MMLVLVRKQLNAKQWTADTWTNRRRLSKHTDYTFRNTIREINVVIKYYALQVKVGAYFAYFWYKCTLTVAAPPTRL